MLFGITCLLFSFMLLFLGVTIAIFTAASHWITTDQWPPPFIGLLPFAAFCVAVFGLWVAFVGFRRSE